MSIVLRVILIIASVINCVWILQQIRKAKVKIEDAVFWILFSGVLIFISICPEVVEIGTKITGVQAPVNFVFLAIIFILILKIFRMTIRISQLENKIQTFAQRYALDMFSATHKRRNQHDFEAVTPVFQSPRRHDCRNGTAKP